MGVVYKAEDRSLAGFSRLSFFLKTLLKTSSALARFQREAQAASDAACR